MICNFRVLVSPLTPYNIKFNTDSTHALFSRNVFPALEEDLLYYRLRLKNKNRYCTLIFPCLFTLTSQGRFLVSPLTPYNSKFFQRGFTKSTAFEKYIPALDEGFLYKLQILQDQARVRSAMYFNLTCTAMYSLYAGKPQTAPIRISWEHLSLIFSNII